MADFEQEDLTGSTFRREPGSKIKVLAEPATLVMADLAGVYHGAQPEPLVKYGHPQLAERFRQRRLPSPASHTHHHQLRDHPVGAACHPPNG